MQSESIPPELPSAAIEYRCHVRYSDHIMRRAVALYVWRVVVLRRWWVTLGGLAIPTWILIDASDGWSARSPGLNGFLILFFLSAPADIFFQWYITLKNCRAYFPTDEGCEVNIVMRDEDLSFYLPSSSVTMPWQRFLRAWEQSDFWLLLVSRNRLMILPTTGIPEEARAILRSKFGDQKSRPADQHDFGHTAIDQSASEIAPTPLGISGDGLPAEMIPLELGSGGTEIHCRLHYTEAVWKRAASVYFWRRMRQRVWWLLGLEGIIIIICWDDTSALLRYSIVFLFTLIISLGVTLLRYVRKSVATLRQMKGGKADIVLREEDFSFSASLGSWTKPWSHFTGLSEQRGFRMLYLKGGDFVSLPTEDMPDEALTFIRSKVPAKT